jgi:hypothetical protein
MLHGNVLPLRPLCLFPFIAGLMAHSSENRLYSARMYWQSIFMIAGGSQSHDYWYEAL